MIINELKNLDDLSSYLKVFDVELIQLQDAVCDAKLIETDLNNGIFIQHVSINFSFEQKGSVAKGYYVFTIIDVNQKQIHNGSELNSHCLIVNEPMDKFDGLAFDNHERISIHIPEEIIKKIFHSVKTGIYKAHNERTILSLKELSYEILLSDLDNEEKKTHYSNLLLNRLEPIVQNSTFLDNAHFHYDYFQKISSYIKENYQKNLTIVEISNKFGISDRTLRNIFMSQVGISPKRYQKVIQLNALKKELIKSKDATVTTCIIKAGLNPNSIIAKDFKKYFGVYPNEFKKSISLK